LYHTAVLQINGVPALNAQGEVLLFGFMLFREAGCACIISCRQQE
jgi:hypothetical protein